jgi:hypothetical protein
MFIIVVVGSTLLPLRYPCCSEPLVAGCSGAPAGAANIAPLSGVSVPGGVATMLICP